MEMERWREEEMERDDANQRSFLGLSDARERQMSRMFGCSKSPFDRPVRRKTKDENRGMMKSDVSKRMVLIKETKVVGHLHVFL